MPSQADHILECRARWLAKVKASGRLDVPRPKAKRHHPKRHNENRERSFRDRMKAAKQKQNQVEATARFKRHSAVVRAYFAGEIDDLSALNMC